MSLGWRLERNDLSPCILCRVVLGLPTPQWHLGDPTVDVSSSFLYLAYFPESEDFFGCLQVVWSVVKEEPEAGVRQDSGLSQGTSWWYVSSKGPAHHWRSICVWINNGRDRWNCWGGRFQLPAQDHFLLVEAVKLWLWPGSLIWRPSAFLDSPLAGVVKWARVRMRGSSQWPPGCW